MWNFQSGTCSAGAIRASRITASWAPSTLTWSNQPVATATDQAQYSPAHGATGCAADEAQWNVTNIVQSWADGSAANYGLRLAAYTETNPNTWRGYWSADSSGGIQKPRLIVTYNRYPSTPTSLQVAPSPDGSHVRLDHADPVGRGHRPRRRAGRRLLRGQAGQHRHLVRHQRDGGLRWHRECRGPVGQSLTDGGQYTVTVRGEDGVAARSKTAASTNVTVDTNVPDVIVTSNVFTNGTWTNTLPSSATTTLNGSADTTAFLVDYDGVKANIKANASGDATMPYAPTPGWHVLAVTPIDTAGNYGTPVTFSHGVGAASFHHAIPVDPLHGVVPHRPLITTFGDRREACSGVLPGRRPGPTPRRSRRLTAPTGPARSPQVSDDPPPAH
ncbi:DNRLRE domain-containing protein [Nocardioides sp. W3-2-3]|uniref:DNRLRE domain-containing protein n=1 Tax=Nocardioides convexus TaxID=2712224 RepID=UPI002418AD63|nr:DNRLRE domain-containing protein [Nocardioides convexus]NHA01379.1 DNRLRE domain-containing protein [Nocardioides convexus]